MDLRCLQGQVILLPDCKWSKGDVHRGLLVQPPGATLVGDKSVTRRRLLLLRARPWLRQRR